jgi:hypothetical protein
MINLKPAKVVIYFAEIHDKTLVAVSSHSLWHYFAYLYDYAACTGEPDADHDKSEDLRHRDAAGTE